VLSHPELVYAEDGASALGNTSGVSHFPTDPAAGCPYREIMMQLVVSMVRWSDPPEK
jgi:hypothetical protein